MTEMINRMNQSDKLKGLCKASGLNTLKGLRSLLGSKPDSITQERVSKEPGLVWGIGCKIEVRRLFALLVLTLGILLPWGGQSYAAQVGGGPGVAGGMAGPGLTESNLQLGGAKIYMLRGPVSGQQLCIVIQSRDGQLMVIDGGLEENRQYLADFIKKHGGRVDYWLLTHPHIDHVGALTALLIRQHDPNTPAEDYSRIDIGDIFYSFAPLDYYRQYEPEHRMPPIEAAYHALSLHAPERLHAHSPAGTTFTMGSDIRVTIMNDAYLIPTDTGNNSSIVYKIEINGKKLMILGDLPYEGSQLLLQAWPAAELKADIVQMAHHGQHGGSPELYQAIAPSYCLWPTPQWLWDKRTEPLPETDTYTISRTFQWMTDLGVKQHAVMAFGDWTLR